MTTEELTERLQTIREIFNECSAILDDIKYMRIVNEKEREIIEGSGYLMRQIPCSWKLLIIELQKVYNKNEDYSIVKLLDILIANHSFIQWENEIDINDLKNYKTKLENKNIADARDVLKNLRNKFVAHLDIDRYNCEIKTEQIEILISFREEIDKINYALNGEEISFNAWKFFSLETIVNEMKNIKQPINQ